MTQLVLPSIFGAFPQLTFTSMNLTQLILNQVSGILKSKSLRMIREVMSQKVCFVRIRSFKEWFVCLLMCKAHKGFCWFFSAARVCRICQHSSKLMQIAQHSSKLMQLDYSHLKVLKSKIYSRSLFGQLLLCPCYLMTSAGYLKHLCTFSAFLSQCNLPNFCC